MLDLFYLAVERMKATGIQDARIQDNKKADNIQNLLFINKEYRSYESESNFGILYEWQMYKILAFLPQLYVFKSVPN
jgi:hypothetical protein